MSSINGNSGGGDPGKSLIACILIRVRLRSCKAIDFILDLHSFSSFNFVYMFGWSVGVCTHMQTTHTGIHTRAQQTNQSTGNNSDIWIKPVLMYYHQQPSTSEIPISWLLKKITLEMPFHHHILYARTVSHQSSVLTCNSRNTCGYPPVATIH